ncbi:hypothetical protein [Pseudanabaena sp. BC1403]|nr:hypothetical protein [Pseudanabaena sp. BC1403]
MATPLCVLVLLMAIADSLKEQDSEAQDVVNYPASFANRHFQTLI